MASASPQRRSQETRARILKAARRQFAAEGFERTTIRNIAVEAEAAPALVIRYFGSKEELFATATIFDLRLPDLSSVPRDAIGRALVEHFLARWEGDPADDALPMLLRAAVTKPQAAERMREIFAHQLLPAVKTIAPRGEATLRAGLVASQILGLALCRYILVLPTVASMRRKDIVAHVGATVQSYLTGERR